MQVPHALRDGESETESAPPASGARLSRPTDPWSDEVQLRLAQLNTRRLRPTLPDAQGFEDVVADTELRVIETHWIDGERRAIAPELEGDPMHHGAPSSASGLVDAMELQVLRNARPRIDLRTSLARAGRLREARWIVGQEHAIEALTGGFEAVAQLGLPRAVQHAFVVRRERALRQESSMTRLARELGVGDDTPLVPEALELANLVVGLAANRRFAFHAVGAFVAQVLADDDAALDLARVVHRAGRSFPTSVIDLETDDRAGWARGALAALLQEHPASARAVLEGSVLRLQAGARRWRRYVRLLRRM